MRNPLPARPGVRATLLAIALAAIPVQAQALSQIWTSVSAVSTSGAIVGADEFFPLDNVTVGYSSGASQASARYANQVIGVAASSSWAANALNGGAQARVILDDTYTVARPSGSSAFGFDASFGIGVTGSLSESNGFAGWRVEARLSSAAYRAPGLGTVFPDISIFARDTTLIDPFPGGDTPLPATLTSVVVAPGTTSFFLYDVPIDLRWIVSVNAGLGGNSGLPGSAAARLHNSAFWLGITARDSQGAIIENLQITSESGTNWLNAAPVPEPALLWLWLPAAGALVLARCRARSSLLFPSADDGDISRVA